MPDGDYGCLTPWDVQSRRIYSRDGVWPTLYGGSGGGKGYVMVSNDALAGGMDGEVTYAVRTAQTSSNGWGISEELAHTLDTTGPEAVAHVLKVRSGCVRYVKKDGTIGTSGKGALVGDDVSFTLAGTQDQTLFDGTSGEYVVRRLTPVETERLQGFPDDWTNLEGCDVDAVTKRVAASLGYDERQAAALRRKVARWAKQTPDGPRYKATGNSFAVPVVRWIGRRIEMVQSIIDGMGGE